jgi:hypothetical protein
MLASRQPLASPAKGYLGKVLDHAERLQAELTLLKKEVHDQKVVLEGRRRQKKGKATGNQG